MVPPEYAEIGDLVITDDAPFLPGVSVRPYDRTGHRTYYDEFSGWVQIVIDENTAQTVAIMPSILFDVGNNGDLNSVWLKPVRED